MNFWDWLILTAVTAAVVAVVVLLIRRRRRGEYNCGCGCQNCTGCPGEQKPPKKDK